jgi:hypothetical protein
MLKDRARGPRGALLLRLNIKADKNAKRIFIYETRDAMSKNCSLTRHVIILSLNVDSSQKMARLTWTPQALVDIEAICELRRGSPCHHCRAVAFGGG